MNFCLTRNFKSIFPISTIIGARSYLAVNRNPRYLLDRTYVSRINFIVRLDTLFHRLLRTESRLLFSLWGFSSLWPSLVQSLHGFTKSQYFFIFIFFIFPKPLELGFCRYWKPVLIPNRPNFYWKVWKFVTLKKKTVFFVIKIFFSLKKKNSTALKKISSLVK